MKYKSTFLFTSSIITYYALGTTPLTKICIKARTELFSTSISMIDGLKIVCNLHGSNVCNECVICLESC